MSNLKDIEKRYLVKILNRQGGRNLMLTFLMMLFTGCDATIDRLHWPVKATLTLQREYSAASGRYGSMDEDYLLDVPGYAPLVLDACEGAELRSLTKPKVVLWRCSPGPWRPVYLGARHLLGGCALAEGEDPEPLNAALPELFACHARPEEVLDEAGEGRAALLLATVNVALPLDDAGSDAWLKGVLALSPAERATLEAKLTTPTTAAGAWRSLRLGLRPTSESASALILALVDAPRDPIRDLVLPALLLMNPNLPDHAAVTCRALPADTELDLGARDLRAALALALGDKVGSCAALALPKDACLSALRCEDRLCSPDELDARVSEALARPIWELVHQPGLNARDVLAAKTSIPESSRLRTTRLNYPQTPANPRCSAAAPGAPCACFDNELLLQTALCKGSSGPILQGRGCEAKVDDVARTIRGRKAR